MSFRGRAISVLLVGVLGLPAAAAAQSSHCFAPRTSPRRARSRPWAIACRTFRLFIGAFAYHSIGAWLDGSRQAAPRPTDRIAVFPVPRPTLPSAAKASHVPGRPGHRSAFDPARPLARAGRWAGTRRPCTSHRSCRARPPWPSIRVRSCSAGRTWLSSPCGRAWHSPGDERPGADAIRALAVSHPTRPLDLGDHEVVWRSTSSCVTCTLSGNPIRSRTSGTLLLACSTPGVSGRMRGPRLGSVP